MLVFASVAGAKSARAQLWSPTGLAATRAREMTGSIPSDSVPALAEGVGFVTPTLYTIWNSSIPYSLNDGALWAGRGFSTSLTTGVTWSSNPGKYSLRAVIAPTIVSSQNLPFQFFPGADPNRSQFSSPWHVGDQSADLPLRFGDRTFTQFTLGETTLEAIVGPVSAGLTSASDWWGPGIRNALVMSDNAAGIPRAFVQTAHPVSTRLGDFAAKLFVGTLTESPYFDANPANDNRTMGGMLVTYRPAIDTTLTLGFTHVAYQPGSAIPSPAHALDGIWRWRNDELFSLFARWLIPEAGTEVYGEWARNAPPRTLREIFVAPEYQQGFTVGLQSSHEIGPARALRAQIEFTNLEQTQVYPNQPPVDFYTARVANQGYTQQGQIIGAAIGPGASSQFVGLDYIVPRWQVGVIAGRTRWENDALLRWQFATNTKHDVSLYSGVRGAARIPGMTLSGQLTVARRFNYLFQNDAYNPLEGARSAVDVQNVTLEFQISK